MLLSADFLASPYAYGRELTRALALHDQHALVVLPRGFYRGPIDGVPGPITERAVAAFQRSAGIVVDARIGPEVIRHLQTPS